MSNTNAPFLPGRLYDVLVWVAQILLPALGALYFGLANIWGLPNAEEVVGTIAIVDLFLGALLGISKHNYNKSGAWADGELTIHREDGVPVAASTDVYRPVEDQAEDRLTLKVVTNDLQV